MKTALLSLFIFFSISSIGQITITIDPQTDNAIEGNLELNRLKYFNLSSNAVNFENIINSPTRVSTYLNDYQMTFGRALGMVSVEVRWGFCI